MKKRFEIGSEHYLHKIRKDKLWKGDKNKRVKKGQSLNPSKKLLPNSWDIESKSNSFWETDYSEVPLYSFKTFLILGKELDCKRQRSEKNKSNWRNSDLLAFIKTLQKCKKSNLFNFDNGGHCRIVY